jgi:hypothetical protein
VVRAESFKLISEPMTGLLRGVQASLHSTPAAVLAVANRGGSWHHRCLDTEPDKNDKGTAPCRYYPTF